jgi:N-acetylmuramoyl-L-alanine amidase
MSFKTILNYSPNFDTTKRTPQKIKFIIFHYTGMKKENDSLNRLINAKSKVSSHYLIKYDGQIIKLVPDLYIAWHAGISFWKNYKFLNKNSIGIEISNPGHGFNYKKFSKKQIQSILKLTKILIKRYKIKPQNILGHSDIAPSRKKDPGEKFPWKYLSSKKIGYWYKLNKKQLEQNRYLKTKELEKRIFLKNLKVIGYSTVAPKNSKITTIKYVKIITKAFQRRFRQDKINGIIDRECLMISENLAKIL